jgi:hypothetical protein
MEENVITTDGSLVYEVVKVSEIKLDTGNCMSFYCRPVA